MPLDKGKSKQAFSNNVRTEMHEGKSQKQSLAIAYAMKRKGKAQGGMVCDETCESPCNIHMSHESTEPKENESANMEDADMIARIMAKRKQFAEGGKVDQDMPEADFMPNEFDELQLSDGLETENTGASNGDELGDAAEDEDRKDIVARIMASRKKKDKLPNPR
jgi:hypothetical protein